MTKYLFTVPIWEILGQSLLTLPACRDPSGRPVQTTMPASHCNSLRKERRSLMRMICYAEDKEDGSYNHYHHRHNLHHNHHHPCHHHLHEEWACPGVGGVILLLTCPHLLLWLLRQPRRPHHRPSHLCLLQVCCLHHQPHFHHHSQRPSLLWHVVNIPSQCRKQIVHFFAFTQQQLTEARMIFWQKIFPLCAQQSFSSQPQPQVRWKLINPLLPASSAMKNKKVQICDNSYSYKISLFLDLFTVCLLDLVCCQIKF